MAKKRAKGSAPEVDDDDFEDDGDNLRQGLLNEEWVDQLPEAVQDAADKYKKALRAKNKAAGNFNSARDLLIEKALENGITRVKVDDGDGNQKWLRITSEPKIKVEKIDNPNYAKHSGAKALDDEAA